MQNNSLKLALESLIQSCTCESPSGVYAPDKRVVAKAKKALKDYNWRVRNSTPLTEAKCLIIN